MNYEKKYEEALERAKNLHKDAIDMGENIRAKQCEIIFPELAESEDEKIRKALIRFHKSTIDVDGIKGEDIIAWIEKQGSNLVENGYTDNKDIIKYADNYSHEIWHKLMDNFKNIKDYHIGCNDVSDIVLNAIIDAYNWLKKQDEQNPLDYGHANIQQKDFAPKATTANRQLYNRAILKILSNYVEKYPDTRFGQMLCNLDVNPHFDRESRETYWNLSKTINKQNHE